MWLAQAGYGASFLSLFLSRMHLRDLGGLGSSKMRRSLAHAGEKGLVLRPRTRSSEGEGLRRPASQRGGKAMVVLRKRRSKRTM